MVGSNAKNAEERRVRREDLQIQTPPLFRFSGPERYNTIESNAEMRKIILAAAIAILLLGTLGQTFAQDHAKAIACPRAFDEYGALRSCDHGARLDNYAIQLQNEPRSSGYIVVYAPESASKRIRDTITDYLVNVRGISAKRIKTFHAGFNTLDLAQPRIQLLIVPKGVEFEVDKSEVDLKTVKGMLTEYKDWDGIERDPGWVFPEDYVDESGWGIGSVTYEAVAEILKTQKQSVAHVVGFNGDGAAPGAWRRVAESTVAALKRLGVESDRYKVGYGGQVKDTKIQIWVLPKGEMPPVKDPASEPAPSKAVQIGDFGEYEVGEPKNELVIFNRLVGMLRENSDLRACLIVRMEVPDREEEPVEIAPEVTSDEVSQEPADFLKLVDKWKSQLAAKHKIGLDRIVVLYSKAQEGHVSSLEVWLVPQGQPLPNPDVEPEEEKPSDVIKDAQRRP